MQKEMRGGCYDGGRSRMRAKSGLKELIVLSAELVEPLESPIVPIVAVRGATPC